MRTATKLLGPGHQGTRPGASPPLGRARTRYHSQLQPISLGSTDRDDYLTAGKGEDNQSETHTRGRGVITRKPG